MWILILKGILAGCVVVTVTLLAEKNAKLAGMFISIPVVTMLSYISIALGGRSETLAAVAKANLIALPVWVFFAAAILIAFNQLPWPLAIFAGFLS